MWKPIASILSKIIINRFHKLYYNSGAFYNSFWLGTQTLKCPFDLWIYQEIIYELNPDIIVECGTFQGGSALFLASICDLVKNGTILTIDIEKKKDRPQHRRIRYLHGSSTKEDTIEEIKRLIQGNDSVMVILDSNHHKDHVLKEMRVYSEFVTPGSYLIVEDTNINGHPVLPDFGPGPMEAIEDFLRDNDNFIIDNTKEKFFLTFASSGYLMKI